MNQENHKEIAGIIEKHVFENKNDLRHPNITEERVKDVSLFLETISKDLASYFERESGIVIIKDKTTPSGHKIVNKFNREQFLKDCGVE